jgi:hypothetical protein
LNAYYVTISDCKFYNNNQMNNSANQYNISVAGKVIRLDNNVSFDDQGSPTVAYDMVVDRQAHTVDAFPTCDIYFKGNTFTLGGFRSFNGGFSSSPQDGTTLHDGGGNKGFNTDGRSRAISADR